MIPGLVEALVELNLAAAVSIGFVLLVRKPARTLAGPRAVYLLWAIAPLAMLATLIPSRTVEAVEPILPDRVVITAVVTSGVGVLDVLLCGLVLVWAIGAIWFARLLIRSQREFDEAADRGAAGPAVAGFCYPHIVTPRDFVGRFTQDERKLILAHEQVHLERGDSRINAAVALARCLCWFNPIVHIGARALRIDQELACDAEVIERRPKMRRAYAETLLKTELAAQPLPVGCYWQAEGMHPLAERIAMLARAPIPRLRRLIASCAVLVMAAGGGITAWAAQPERTVFLKAIDVLVPFQPLARADIREPPALFDPSLIDTEPAHRP